MDVNSDRIESFADPAAFCDWLSQNHAKASEVWIKIFKKASKVPSVTWEETVIEAIAWGWIDGLRKSNDETSYFQRFTRRTKTSGWSRKNCDHAQTLIQNGRMRAPGLLEIEKAKSDGRWALAYAGSAEMEIPGDFLTALATNSAAEAFFQTLNKANLFAIYYRLHTAKKPQTRQDRMQRIIEMLARGEKFH
jgi:uncharacterized protein YdeI (YjbR/CyaY-like superfamily)